MRPHWPVLALALGMLVFSNLRAQDQSTAPKEHPAHEELRALKAELTAAINKNDLDGLLKHLDEDVVVVWQNGEVSRKPAGVREYYERMLKGPDHPVQSVTIDPTVAELTHLYGDDTGVAFGHSNDLYKMTDGNEYHFKTHWTATVVKKDGKWRVGCFHASVNMFDNPVLLTAVRRTALWVAVAAAAGGLLLGALFGLVLGRRRRPMP